MYYQMLRRDAEVISMCIILLTSVNKKLHKVFPQSMHGDNIKVLRHTDDILEWE